MLNIIEDKRKEFIVKLTEDFEKEETSIYGKEQLKIKLRIILDPQH